jgi:hypothetical protein
MQFLSFDEPQLEDKKAFRRNISILTILIVALSAIVLRTTLASNISINTGSPIQFGQGLAMTTNCSGSTALTLLPIETFTNATGTAGSFSFTGFTLSNIPAACYGNDFTISAYDSSTTSPLPLVNSSPSSVVVWDNLGNFVGPSTQSGITLVTNSPSSFTATFATPVTSPTSIYKFTIDSAGNSITLTCAQGGSCNVGDTGPGGGTVFYINTNSFTEVGASCSSNCHYLEAAATNWNGGGVDPAPDWCATTNNTNAVGATYLNLGGGLFNTSRMMNQNGGCASTSAGYLAYNYAATDSSAHSWFVADQQELNELCKYANSETTGNTATACTAGTLRAGFGTTYYWWSSSEYAGLPSTQVWNIDFSQGNLAHGNLKSGSTLYVRPIRAF